MSSRIERIPESVLEAKARDAAYRPSAFAALCQMSLRQMERHFLAKHGLTPRTWLDKIRLHDAQEVLIQGEYVKVVALQVGFSQSKHFSRWYRRLTGVNPSRPIPTDGALSKMSLLRDECRSEGVQYHCGQNGQSAKNKGLASQTRQQLGDKNEPDDLSVATMAIRIRLQSRQQ